MLALDCYITIYLHEFTELVTNDVFVIILLFFRSWTSTSMSLCVLLYMLDAAKLYLPKPVMSVYLYSSTPLGSIH